MEKKLTRVKWTNQDIEGEKSPDFMVGWLLLR